MYITMLHSTLPYDRMVERAGVLSYPTLITNCSLRFYVCLKLLTIIYNCTLNIGVNVDQFNLPKKNNYDTRYGIMNIE